MNLSDRLGAEVATTSAIPSLDQLPCNHVLIVVAKGVAATNTIGHEVLARVRVRQRAAADACVGANVADRLLVQVVWDFDRPAFERLTALRTAADLLLKESPREIAVVIHAPTKSAGLCAEEAVYTTLVNGRYTLGKVAGSGKHGEGSKDGKDGKDGKDAKDAKDAKDVIRPKVVAALATIAVFGAGKGFSPRRAQARAEGNLLCRALTLRPPNDLTPKRYRRDVEALAKASGWQHREWDQKALLKLGAGAFCAVAQGSPHRDAAIVKLSYRPNSASRTARKPVRTIALVGKGICMDTGGHGLKSAKGMYGMHEDMNGSAVVLGILKAASDLKLPVAIDAWLAIAQNHIGPEAYQPGDIVTALDGSTIEVVHTDAEGRMVLADTLTLAAREKPALMLDFATLTGAMIYALGTRISGVFANRPALAEAAAACGLASGERVTLFPLDADYDDALESKVADVKQCLIAGEADSIYAARFLARFVADQPWVHMDLSAARNEGGLGAVSADLNGFGVGWGLAMLEAD